MVSNMDILVEVLTALRAYEHRDDPDAKRYEETEAQSDLDALILMTKGDADGVLKMKNSDKLFMLAVRLTNRIYDMIKADQNV